MGYLFFSLLSQKPWPKQLKRKRDSFASQYADATKGNQWVVMMQKPGTHKNAKLSDGGELDPKRMVISNL